jgi:hypothetical protein
MADHLTDAQLIQRCIASEEARHNGFTQASAAESLGIAPRVLRESLETARARGLSAASHVPDELDRAKAKISRLEAEVKGLQRATLTAEQVREEIYGLSSLLPEPPKWMTKVAKTVKTAGVPMTIWSDWHWGETVHATEVGGVNEFNRAVAHARVQRLVKTTISLAKEHMVRPSYPGIVVCLGGDMITGAIHEELAWTNWGSVQEQFLEVQEDLIWALSKVADAFGRVFVPCVIGNHGRNTIKSHMKGRVVQNYEWNLYNQLERTFRGDKRFQFLVPGETDAYFSVYDHRFLLTHGDTLGVKGGDGIIGALGPIARGTFKVGRSEAQIGRDFDTLLMGHYHTYMPRGGAVSAIVNGSLIGYNEYARLGLRVPYSRPSQALWFVHPDHGITAQWEVYLDDKRKSAEGAQWVGWQAR